MPEKNVKQFLHHYIGQEVEVEADWKFKPKDTALTLSYHKGFRLPLVGAVYDMITRRDNPLTVKLIARRYTSMTDSDKIKICGLVEFSPFELNDGVGYWYARNYLSKERFRVDLEPTALNGFAFWTEDTPKDQITCPSNKQLTEISDYLQSQGIWTYGDDWFNEGLLIEK